MSIATQIEALQADKSAIRDAIIAKGGTCTLGNGFDDFATDIATIPSGLSGKIKVYTMNSTFRTRTEATIPTELFDTSEAISMTMTFYQCVNVTSLDVSEWVTSNSTTFASMFNGCTQLTDVDVSNFDTSQATSLSQMFYGCAMTMIDATSFDTSAVTASNGFKSMFGNNTALKEVVIGPLFTVWSNATAAADSPIYKSTKIETLRIKNPTPPSITHINQLYTSSTKSALKHIYVPASAVATYQAHSIWGQYSTIISADPEE